MANGGLTEVGKYRIVGQIGEGAMGVVYRALDPVLNRPVAIKVMSDALARDDELRKRFLREAQAAGSLQHPNVITIYDFGEVEGHLYIAMEFVAGEDLEDVLLKQRVLTPLQKVDIIIDVLGGLAYAHKRGIVHRDIKPANIRIDDDGRARIMDFGIAHLSSSTMTKTGIMVGTPAYMAPEQIVGGAIVPATDLFSVGAVMYELLAGKKPFAAESLQSVFYKIVSTPAPDLLDFAPQLPPALNTIVQKALAKDPEDRYASALDMANALTAVRGQIDSLARQSKSISLRSEIETGLATRPSMAAPTMPKRTRRTTYIAAGVGAAVVIVSAAIALRPSHDAATSALPAATPAAPPSVVSRDTTAASTVPGQQAAPSQPPAPGAAVVPAGTASSPAPAASNPGKATTAKSDVGRARDLELFHSIQVTALDARRRAVDAGATNDQLQAGDEHNKRATALANEGKVTDAAARLNLATTAWFNAERDARAAAAAAASAKTRAAEQAKPDPVTQPAAPAVASPVTAAAPPQTVPAPRQTPPPAPVANPSVEIATVLATYARAISSRDVNEVKRAFPDATSEQIKGFDEFFVTLKSLRATLSLSGLDVQGASAEGRVTGAYDCVTIKGTPERIPVDFQATFRRDGSGWRLVAVRNR